MTIVGMILLGLGLLILLLLCIPVLIILRYHTDQPPVAYLRWAFLKFDLRMPEKKQSPPPAAPAEKPAAPPKRAAKPPMEFAQLAGIVLDLLSAAKGGAGMLIRRFRLYKIRLHLVVAEEDAAETAIAYGGVNAAVYAAYSLAVGFLNMKRPDIEIRPDFLATQGTVDFELRGRLLPIVALAAGIRTAAAFLLRVLQRRRRETVEAKEAKVTGDAVK